MFSQGFPVHTDPLVLDLDQQFLIILFEGQTDFLPFIGNSRSHSLSDWSELFAVFQPVHRNNNRFGRKFAG